MKTYSPGQKLFAHGKALQVAKNIRQEIKRAGLNATEMAKIARVSQGYTIHILQGNRNAGLEILYRYAIALDVPITRLIPKV